MIVVERCWTSGFVDRIYGRPQPHFAQLSFLRPRWFVDIRSIRNTNSKSLDEVGLRPDVSHFRPL